MSGEEDNTERSTTFENDKISLGAAESITFEMGSGTDTSTIRYMNIPHGVSYGIEIIPTVACSLSELNGVTPKSAISIGTGGFRTNHMKVKRFTINAGSATVVEVFAKGGF